MRVRFVGQPFEDSSNLHDFFTGALANSKIDELTVVTAWAKRSGLGRIEAELQAFRHRGGASSIILGIDEGGATEQGLRLAMELFDSTYVFRDRNRRTFHPKLYVAKGDGVAEVLTGSNNLTAGGVYFNYETADHFQLDLTDEEDADYLLQVEAYVGALLSEEELCLELDEDLLQHLLADPGRYRIRDEDESRRSERRTADEPEDTDQHPADDIAPDRFGRPATGRRPDPRPRGRRREPGGPRPPAPPATAAPATETRTAGVPADVELRWFKQLPKADAQQNAGNQTGNLRLTQAGHDIDWLSFFREDFFGDADWRVDRDHAGNPKEVAFVEFDVVFHDEPLGQQVLRVAHAPHRESGQHNHATALHWDDLNARLRQSDYTGSWVVLERLQGGSFRLRIQPDEPDEALLSRRRPSTGG